MAGERITAGDVVQLRSGGPPMTVDSIPEGADYGICSWFIGAKAEQSTFPLISLRRADSDPPNPGLGPSRVSVSW